MDNELYEQYNSESEKAFESICNRCGECCGSKDDPCQNLAKGDDGRYLCKDYSNRLGPQNTAGGHGFSCVPIRQHIADGTLRPGMLVS